MLLFFSARCFAKGLAPARGGLSRAVFASRAVATMVRYQSLFVCPGKCWLDFVPGAQGLCSPVADFRATGEEGKATWAARCSARFSCTA